MKTIADILNPLTSRTVGYYYERGFVSGLSGNDELYYAMYLITDDCKKAYESGVRDGKEKRETKSLK